MSEMLLPHPPKANADLEAMLKQAAQHIITPAERHAQARSWVIGQMMLSHPEMSRAEAEAHADKAVGPNFAARVAELEAENARLRAERDELLVDQEAMSAKLDALAPHGTCGCSYDHPDHVCLHHAPQLAKAEAENARMKAAAELLVDRATTMVRVFNDLVAERDELKVALAVCEGRSACNGAREKPVVPRFPN